MPRREAESADDLGHATVLAAAALAGSGEPGDTAASRERAVLRLLDDR